MNMNEIAWKVTIGGNPSMGLLGKAAVGRATLPDRWVAVIVWGYFSAMIILFGANSCAHTMHKRPC